MTTAQFDEELARTLTRAEHLLGLGRPQEALSVLDGVLAEHPENVTALCGAAQAEIQLGRPERAEPLTSRAVRAAPELELPLRLRAFALHLMEKPFEAAYAARAARALAPDAWQTHLMVAIACSGKASLLKEARQAAERAVALGPLESDTHSMLGYIACELEDLETAQRCLDEALRLDPNNAEAHTNRGRLRLLRKDPVGAANHFATAAASAPQSPVAAGNLDVALASAVSKITTWVGVVVFIFGRFVIVVGTDDATSDTADYILAVILLLVVACVAVRVVLPALRGRARVYVRATPHRDPQLTVIVGLLAIGVGLLMAMCLLPVSIRVEMLIGGIVALVVSRIMLEIYVYRKGMR